MEETKETMKNKVQQVVNEIYEDKQEVRPSELLRRSKPKDSPTHGAFEWDNRKAGHEFRLIQARQWIRRVTITVENREERLIHVPILRIADSGEVKMAENYYKPVSAVAQDDSEFERALNYTLAQVKAAKSAFEYLTRAKKEPHPPGPEPDFDRASAGFTMIEEALTV